MARFLERPHRGRENKGRRPSEVLVVEVRASEVEVIGRNAQKRARRQLKAELANLGTPVQALKL
jgi:hypothetical protein